MITERLFVKHEGRTKGKGGGKWNGEKQFGLRSLKPLRNTGEKTTTTGGRIQAYNPSIVKQ